VFVTVFAYLILISKDFFQFCVSNFSFVVVSTEKIYQTLKTMFDHISKHLEVRQKYRAAHRIFSFLLCVWKYGHTQSFFILYLGPFPKTSKVFVVVAKTLTGDFFHTSLILDLSTVYLQTH